MADTPSDASAPPAPPVSVASHCRNCGGAIAAADAYCRHCGQETHIALPTARQFLREAAGRYVALDGRLWRTLKALLLRPGFLTLEYIGGRRRRYIRPGRLFLVTSIVAFAAIRLVADPTQIVTMEPGARDAATRRPAVAPNTAQRAAKAGQRDHGKEVGSTAPPAATNPAPGGSAAAGGDDDNVIIESDAISLRVDRDMNLVAGGSSPQVPMLRERLDHFNELPRDAKIRQLAANMFRYGPYAAIALLPAFALLLLIVYPLRSRRYPQRPRRFAAHLVFAAHNHAFLFSLAVLAAVLPSQSLAVALLMVAATIYLLASLRAVYGGGWPLTLARAFVLFVAYMLLFGLFTMTLLAIAVILQ